MLLLALLLSIAQPLIAQDNTTIFDQLSGAWDGEGTLMGRAAQFSMRWQRDDGFAVLAFSNGFRDETGEIAPVLNSVAVYRTTADNPEAVWLDSRGVRVEIRWEASDSALISHWTAPTEAGRTTYRVRSGNEVEVIDEVRNGDAWRTFARASYVRNEGRD